MTEQVSDIPEFTGEAALTFVAKHFADTVVREQSVAGQQTLDFLDNMEAFGDSDLKEKIVAARKELEIIRSEGYYKALNNLYFEIYSKLPERYIIRLADSIEFDTAVVQVGALNGIRVQALIDDYLDGTYKAPTLQ